jgi:hypothetical protein
MSQGAFAVLVAFLIAHTGGCKGSVQRTDRPCSPITQPEQMNRQEKLMGEPITPKLVTFVESIDKSNEGPGSALEVVFYGHSAIFYLDRDHPCFASWLRLLRKSHDEHSTIVFAWSGFGMLRIASLELATTFTGVVGRIDEDVPARYVGFKIPEYAHIFDVPMGHPQFQNWLKMLWKSHHEQRKIVFTYDAYHRRVTSLALAEE